MKNDRLMTAFGQIDEKYIKEAERNMNVTSIIKIAVAVAVVITLGLVLFIPYSPVTSDISGYSGSEYFPLIEGIEEYRLGLMQPKYKNNFDALCNSILMFGASMAPGDMGPAGGSNAEGSDNNGNYLEATDNQVEGVIESDLFKMTDKYIFRLGYLAEEKEFENDKGSYTQVVPVPILRVYSINKEDSSLVAEFKMPAFANEYFKDYNCGEMFLSLDGNTITVIKNYTDFKTNKGKVGIISIDVSSVGNISTKAMVSIDGSLNTSRMVDGKLLLVSEYYFNRNNLDYNDPLTFVPGIDAGDGAKPIEFKDIIYPDKVGNTRYSVVALLDAETLELKGANALLNFTENVYISETNVYISREYSEKTTEDGGYKNSNKSDIAVIDYSGAELQKKGVITVRGVAEDQYSFDEKDGYLRVVTSTFESVEKNNGDTTALSIFRNAGLYVFDLSNNSLAYKVEDFAPNGEQVTAVRFDGDKCYVCTAVVVSFTDPVYFFDLSDYENIIHNDTGIIEGYSDHLINYGDGFALGIGRLNWEISKVDMYEEGDGAVLSVDSFEFIGQYSTDYKSYLVNRDEKLFGFGVERYYEDGDSRSSDKYILLHFNGYEFTVYKFDVELLDADSVRAAYIDGYLYITTNYEQLRVYKVN